MEATIKELCKHSPWKPFQFQTTQGEWVTVNSPDTILPAFDELVYLDTRTRNLRMFSMLHIVEARHVDVGAKEKEPAL